MRYNVYALNNDPSTDDEYLGTVTAHCGSDALYQVMHAMDGQYPANMKAYEVQE
jgi:hypothetical protein